MAKWSFGFFRQKQVRCSNVDALHIFCLPELTVPGMPSAPHRKERVLLQNKAERIQTFSQLKTQLCSKLPPSFLTATSDSKLMI